jgi:Bacterial Ig domain
LNVPSRIRPSHARWPYYVVAALLALVLTGVASATRPDNTAPTGSFTSPANGATVSGTITVTGTASDNVKVAKVEVEVDGGAYQLASGTTSWSLSLNTTAYSDGTHNLKLRVTDTAGNQAWFDLSIVVSNTVVSAAPNVGFTSPSSGATVKGTITVTGTASSGAGVARVEVEVVGGNYQLASGTTSWSLTLNTTAYADGAQTLKARVTDNKGVQAWADLPILISNTVSPPPTAPVVNFTSPASGSTVKWTITLTGTAGSPAGVSKVEVRVDGGNYMLASGTTSWSISINTTAYADGQHDFKARITDTTGAQAWNDDYLTVSNGTGTSHQIYWGAFINGAQYGFGTPPWDWRSVDTFDSHAAKNISMLALGSSWGSSSNTFPTAAMDAVRSHGMIPFYSWASMTAGGGSSDPNFQLQDIINGNYDSYITTFAQAAKAWGHPFFLRFDWEMNLIGTFPWVQTVNGNSAGQYVTMWRHVHDIFTKVGATNVTWVWCPNAEYNGSWSPLSSLYPGDAYVDWTCIDGYNWGTNPWYVGHTWQTFTSVFNQTYNDILSFAPTKPIMIGETGSTEYGGSKGNWINSMLAQELPVNFPKIKGFMWFNWFAPPDWDIETSSTAQNAFASSIQSSYYATNTFGSLGGTTIQPLP